MNMQIDLLKMSAMYAATDQIKLNGDKQAKTGFSQVLEGALKSVQKAQGDVSAKPKQLMNAVNRLERLLQKVQVGELAGESVSSEQTKSEENASLAEQPWIQGVLNLLFTLADLQMPSNEVRVETESVIAQLETLETGTQEIGQLAIVPETPVFPPVVTSEQELISSSGAEQQLLNPESLNWIIQALQDLDNLQPIMDSSGGMSLSKQVAELTNLSTPVEMAASAQLLPNIPEQLNSAGTFPTHATVEQNNAQPTNSTEATKLSGQLKGIMELMLQGKVTIAAAAEAIVNEPGMLEQLGVLAKIVKLQFSKKEPTQGENVNSDQVSGLAENTDTMLPTKLVESVPLSNTKLVELVPPSNTKLAVKATDSASSLPVLQSEDEKLQATELNPNLLKQNKAEQENMAKHDNGVAKELKAEQKKEQKTEQKTEQAATTKQGESLIFSSDNQQLENVQPIFNNDVSLNELPARMAKTKVESSARELASHLIYKQIVDQSAMIVSGEHSEVRIHLKPEFLGKMSLEIAVEQGVVKAEIVAESQQVKQLIEANLSNLKQTLTNQGLKVEHLIVNLGQGQAQSGQAKEQSNTFTRQTKKSRNADEVFEIAGINTEYGGHLADQEQIVDYKV